MLYSYAIKKLVRQSFENVNNHNYDELLKAVAQNVHHRFATRRTSRLRSTPMTRQLTAYEWLWSVSLRYGLRCRSS
jgi:hypothetical protein